MRHNFKKNDFFLEEKVMNNKIVLKFDSQKKKNSIEVVIQFVDVGLFIFWTRSHSRVCIIWIWQMHKSRWIMR